MKKMSAHMNATKQHTHFFKFEPWFCGTAQQARPTVVNPQDVTCPRCAAKFRAHQENTRAKFATWALIGKALS